MTDNSYMDSSIEALKDHISFEPEGIHQFLMYQVPVLFGSMS